MRTNQAPVARGQHGSSDIKKELRERDKDESWKSEELKKAKEKAKTARAPDGGKDRTAGLSVPKRGKQ